MATISSNGVASLAKSNIPTSFQTAIQPMLQAADGTYFGTTSTATGNQLVHFDASGNLLGISGNSQPAIATADGGLIATTPSGSAVTLDASLNITGIMANLPTQSWAGSSYQQELVDFVLLPGVALASSFWPVNGVNNSGNNTAIKQQWFPPLDSCTSTVGCIGPHEVAYNALDDLTSRLNSDPHLTAIAQSTLFDKLGNDANGNRLTTNGFINYLRSKRPELYNGLTSSYCYLTLTGGAPCIVEIITGFGSYGTVSEELLV